MAPPAQIVTNIYITQLNISNVSETKYKKDNKIIIENKYKYKYKYMNTDTNTNTSALVVVGAI